MRGRVVNIQIKKCLLLSLSVRFFKSVNIWILQSCKQERGCLVHFLRLLTVWWPGVQSARHNLSLACNFSKYSPVLNIFFH